MPDARAHAPATSCLPARRWTHPRAPRTLPGLALSPVPSPPFFGSLSLPPSGARRRRSPPPQPTPLPQPPERPRSSATPSSTSSLSYATPDALKPRQCRRFRPRLPEIPVVVSPDTVPPLPCQKHQKNRGEPLYRSPHDPSPISLSNRIRHRSRMIPAAGHVAAAVTTPAGRPRACWRAQPFLGTPQTPPVRLETHCSA